MKILHVIAGAATGGAETFCLDAITALAERGIEQRVTCRPHAQTVARLGAAGVPFEPLSFAPASRLIGVSEVVPATASGPSASGACCPRSTRAARGRAEKR